MTKQPATKLSSKGICNFCQSEVDKTKMTQHLKYCKQRVASIAAKYASARDAQKTSLLHLVVEGRYDPQYWMHLEMPATSTLYDLDDFLRSTWLECCGHLSAFQIGKMSYMSQTEDMMWEVGDVVEEEDEEGEEDEEEDEYEDDLFDQAIEEELANTSPTEAATKLVEILAQEFEANPLELPPTEFEAKLKELLTTRMQQETGAALTPELQAQLESLVPTIRAGLMLASNPIYGSVFDRMARESDMNVKLGKVLKAGQKCTYEYDFGSTTDLSLRVVAEREGISLEDEESIQIMARNNPPVIPCRVCDKPASGIISGYLSAEYGALCEECMKKPEVYGEYESRDMMLPVVNSPREGVCAYTGNEDGEWDDDWEEYDEDEEEE